MIWFPVFANIFGLWKYINPSNIHLFSYCISIIQLFTFLISVLLFPTAFTIPWRTTQSICWLWAGLLPRHSCQFLHTWIVLYSRSQEWDRMQAYMCSFDAEAVWIGDRPARSLGRLKSCVWYSMWGWGRAIMVVPSQRTEMISCS